MLEDLPAFRGYLRGLLGKLEQAGRHAGKQASTGFFGILYVRVVCLFVG